MIQENSKGGAYDRSVPNDEIFNVIRHSQNILFICGKYNVPSKNGALLLAYSVHCKLTRTSCLSDGISYLSAIVK